MNRLFIRSIVILSLIFAAQPVLHVVAQEKDYHVFTDKKGQTIEAALLSITPDKAKLGIEFKDGRKFEIPILDLSLTDQQFIQDWMKSNSVKLDYNLEIKFVKHQESTDRIEVPNRDLKWVTDTTTIEIIIKNRSREDLVGASLEYYIITEQAVHASPLSPESRPEYGVEEWWYSNALSGSPKRTKITASKKPLWLIHGKVKIKDLPTNYSMEVKSDPFPLREISQKDSRNPKDTVLGVIARVTDKDGNEINVYRSNENKFLKRGWDEIAQMPPGNQSGEPQPAPND